MNFEASKGKTYESLDEFIKAEKINIITPTYLPNGADIREIIIADHTPKLISVLYDNDSKDSLIIKLDINIITEEALNGGDLTKYTANGIDFYIVAAREGADVNIWWVFENNSYQLWCEFNPDEFEKIIKSIK